MLFLKNSHQRGKLMPSFNADFTASPNPRDGEDGDSDQEHASDWSYGSGRNNRSSYRYRGDPDLPSSDFCIGRSNPSLTLKDLVTDSSQTFFSTDVIKYQNQSGGNDGSQDAQTSNGSFSQLALYRWMELALPLTAITLSLGYIWYKIARKKRESLLPFFKLDPEFHAR